MKKTSLGNRLLSLVLCLCMVLSMMPASTLRVFAIDETTGSNDTAASYAAKIGDTYYLTLAQAAEAVTEDSNTIEVLTDVTIDADETVTFAAFAQLSVAEGKSITCNGTVMIGEDAGIIFENTLYYYGGDEINSRVVVPNTGKPIYFKAGEGYIIGTATGYGETATGTMKLVNATVNALDGIGILQRDLTLSFFGVNTITATDGGENFGIYSYDTSAEIGYVILSGAEGAVLNIATGDATVHSRGIYAKSVTITGGTVNVTSGNAPNGVSTGIDAASVVVEEGATLNLTVGKAAAAVGSTGLVSGAGTVNGLILVPADNALGAAFAASGNTVLIADFLAAVDNQVVPFSVPAGTSLTVNEGVTVDLSDLTAADITFAGTVINNGTILLPADFALENAPKSGIVKIGEKTYTYDSANSKWSCSEDSHTGGTATCTTQAVCAVCGASYGEVDLTNHDETVSFDDNGFCPNGCYAPATLNADGCYEISNAGQLYWFMEKVNSGDTTINGVLTANIVVNKNVLTGDGTLNGDGTNFRAWFPIGYWHDCDGDGAIEDVFFRGKFDGQGHTVSGLYFNNEAQTCVGLFGEIDSNATVKNVGVIASYLNGSSDVGGVVGYNEGTITGCYSNATVSGRSGNIGGVVGENQGTVENCYSTGTVSGMSSVGGVVGDNQGGTVTNCYNTGSVTGSSDSVGGVAGDNQGGTVTNCYNTGAVSGNRVVGGVVGYNYGTVTNCYNTGSVSCSDRGNGGVEGGGTGTVTNCYYLDTCGASGKATAKTADQFASGEVAYLLNGDQSSIVFKQTIGTDVSPNFIGKTVYYGYTSCAADAQRVYTNDETASETKPGHTFGDNGFCEYCGVYESAVLNGDVYEISNAGQLMWFAGFVNAGNFTAGAVLTDDIDMNGLHWTPIGTETAYTGTFDGKGFAIKNLWQNSDGASGGRDGLVVTLGTGGAIMGVTIDNAAIWGADLYSTNGAGVIANRNYGTISGCVVKNSSVQQGAYEYLGGIAGENSGAIENCAVIGCSFTRRWGGTDSGSMGAITQTNNGTVKNCFSYGCSFNNGRADKAAIVAINNGTLENCYYYTNSTVATTYGTAKTAEQFASGEVAYLLGEAFGQTIGTEDYPILGGKKVYYGYVSCADDAVMEYTNNENASAEKPDHTGTLGEYEPTADGTQHARKWSCCETAVTEAHSTTADGDKAADCNSKAYCSVCKSEYGDVVHTNHDETVSFDDNGFCPNGCYEPAILNADGCYEISNAGQLYWFMEKVNSSDTAINGVLTANIVVNKNVLTGDGTLNGDGTNFRAWFPIGYWHDCDGDGAIEDIFFRGTFDGQGHTISGLYFNNQNQISVGLFGEIDSNATVKNVGVIDSYLNCSGDLGGVVGYNDGGTVMGCYSNASIISTTENVGGVVGQNRNGTVENCYHTGSITSISYHIGGVVGYNLGTVINCYNTGTVTGNEKVGGVLGNNSGSGTVTTCYNTGTVTGSEEVGGVVGYNLGTMTNCYNTGSVTGSNYVGGVAGYSDDHVQNCYSTGTVSGSGNYVGGVVGYSDDRVQNCYSTGTVSGNGYHVGGVVGYVDRVELMENCYYLSGCATDGSGVTQFGAGNAEMGSTTADRTGDVEAKTAEQFASGEVAYLLNGSTSEGELVWKQTIGTNASPDFTGKTVYYGYVSCADDAVMVYSNDPDANVTKPAHTLAEDDGDCTTAILCAACGDPMVQGKTAHDFVAGLTCGNDGCKVEATVSVSGNGDQETRYATLRDAFAAVSSATAQDNTVVKLLADIDLDIYNYQITSGIFTLDLNGKTVTSAATWEAITVNGTGAMLTVTDSGTGGTIRNMDGTAGAAVGVLEGTLVVSGGILTGRVNGVYVYGGRAEINGGTISGGTFGVDVGDATVTITGGVINGDAVDVYIYGSTVMISGGTFPGGISISHETTLNAILAEGAAYWQDGKQLTVADDAIEITGGDVVVKPACVHNWVAATCVAPKTCSVCGTTEGEALGHSYDNDVCTVCGHIGVPVKLDSASLSFKEKIHYNIFFSLGLDENVDLSDMGLILFDSLNPDGTVDDAIAIYSGAVEMDGKYMVATDGVHAKRMGDTIYFRVYAKLADGSYVYSKTVQYSAVTYAEHILAGDQPESAKALVVAMLNYGAAAQKFFGYNTDNLVNAFLTEEQKALPEQYRDDMVNTVPVVAGEKQGSFANNKGFSMRKPAVSFEGAFEINYFFTPAYAPVDGITLYYWTEADFEANEVLTADNATGSIKLEGTGMEQYSGDIGGIAAKNLSGNIYVAAIYSDGTTTWTSGVLGYSIGAYCGRLAAKGGAMADLAMATAVYGYHAKQYFG